MQFSSSSPIELSIVVPVYQEEKVIPNFLSRIQLVLSRVTEKYEIIFCMDPGKDKTQNVIEEFVARDPRIRLLVFTRRFGQPACTIAGIENCRGDACVVIDVDLQDPPEVIAELYKKSKEGFDVVYARRRTREGETIPKRIVSFLAYRVISKISDVSVPKDTGDFRLINRRVIEALRSLKETHGYLRGLVAYVGFRQTEVLYDRSARVAGQSKYSQLTGSLKIGINGLITNSSRPMTFILMIGLFFIGLGSVVFMASIFASLLGKGAVVVATTFLASVGVCLAGLILFSIGICGEYIARIYDEARMRPKYLIAEEIDHDRIVASSRRVVAH